MLNLSPSRGRRSRLVLTAARGPCLLSHIRSRALLVCSLIAGCVPLSGPLLKTADSYQDVLATNSDTTLLDNVLRASDYAPLNISSLSTITGTLNLSGGFTPGIPIGPNNASTPRTLGPTISAGTSPTFTMTPLNTEGFTTNLVQAVSPLYVIYRWHAGVDPHLLKHLFVKWVRLPPRPGEKLSEPCTNMPGTTDQCREELFASFRFLHSVTIMEPIGPEYSSRDVAQKTTNLPYFETPSGHPCPDPAKSCTPGPTPPTNSQTSSVSETTTDATDTKGGTTTTSHNDTKVTKSETDTPPAAAATAAGSGDSQKPAAGTTNTRSTVFPQADPAAQAVLQGLNLATGLGDGQYHVGNSPTVKGNLQLYRVYTGQVIVCSDSPAVQGYTSAKPSRPSPQASAPQKPAAANVVNSRVSALLKQMIGGGHMPPSGPAAPAAGAPGAAAPAAKGAGAAPAAAAGGTAQANATAVLQANQTSAILYYTDAPCIADQVVLPRESEEDAQARSETFAHVEWRSTAELFEYLGAIAHMNRSSAAEDQALAAQYKKIFAIETASPSSLVTSKYRDTTYGVSERNSMIALQMVGELVNLSKISSDISASSPALFLPIP